MTRQQPIYLDNNATTRVDPRVLEAMLPYFTEFYGNAASLTHSFGRAAEAAVTKARQSLARSINAQEPAEIVFTSGATESDNLAIKGVAEAHADKGKHIVTCRTEHRAVLDACKHLEKQGYRTTYLEVDRNGLIDLDELAAAITEDTILVSIMMVNNEIGTIQDVGAIGRLCRSRGVLFHTDATQAVGKLPFDVQALQIDLASFTAHKIYGPKGVGALYVRGRGPEVHIIAQMDGGGHERGCRSGTLNVPGIVGLAKAMEICLEEMEEESHRLVYLREKLKRGLMDNLEGVRINGHETQRAPGNLNVSFEDVDGDRLLFSLPEIAVSTASACRSATGTVSHVLEALGVDTSRPSATVRFSIGRYNTEEEIDYTIARVVETVKCLRRSHTA